MAYKPYNYGEDEGKTSEWNSAQFKMRRLDKLMTLLNEINSNLLAYNVEYNRFNFELKFEACISLYYEVESKLSKDERLQGTTTIEAIEYFIEKYPIFKTIIVEDKTEQKINKINFKILKKWLFQLEVLVRQFIDRAGMDTAYDDDEGMF